MHTGPLRLLGALAIRQSSAVITTWSPPVGASRSRRLALGSAEVRCAARERDHDRVMEKLQYFKQDIEVPRRPGVS
jgi:hypothetical protein